MMSKFDIKTDHKKRHLRRDVSRQKDPREQERYCHISFFDGWQRVILTSGFDYRPKRQTPISSKSTIVNYKHI